MIPLFRPFTALIMGISIACCQVNPNPDIRDKKSAFENFKRGTELYTKAITTQVDSSNSPVSTLHLQYYQESLNYFNAALEADPTIPQYAFYLSDVYFYLGRYDSALIWYRRMVNFDTSHSAENARSSSEYYFSAEMFYGKCHLLAGNLDSAKFYFNDLVRLDSKATPFNIATYLQEIAIELKENRSKHTSFLPKTIDRCEYAILIMQYGRELLKGNEDAADGLFPLETIERIRTRCL